MLKGFRAATRDMTRTVLRSPRPSERAPRLRRTRRLVGARGLVRAALGLAGAATVLALVALCAGFLVLASGPIDLEALKPSLTRGLEERLGAGYRVNIASTFLIGTPHGLGVGFGRIEIRDAAGRTVVAAPGGRVGLDALALVGLEVKIRRLELDGLTVSLRVRPDGGLSVAAAESKDAASIELTPPGAASAPAPDIATIAAGLVDALAGLEPGARPCFARQWPARGRKPGARQDLGLSGFPDRVREGRRRRPGRGFGARAFGSVERHGQRARRNRARARRGRARPRPGRRCSCSPRGVRRSIRTCRFRSSSTRRSRLPAASGR